MAGDGIHCLDCGQVITGREGKRGPKRERCDRCKKAHKIQWQREKRWATGTRKGAIGKRATAPRREVPCDYCGREVSRLVSDLDRHPERRVFCEQACRYRALSLYDATERRCSGCHEMVPRDQYGPGTSWQGRSSICRSCTRHRAAENYRRDPERVLQGMRRRYREDPVLRERIKRRSGQWRRQNPEAAREAWRAWRLANPDRVKDANRRWRRRNPEFGRLNTKRYQTRKRGVPTIRFTPVQLAQRVAYHGEKCWICQGPWDSIDHVKPITKGGAHMLCNLRPICRSCNASKGNRWPFDLQSHLARNPHITREPLSHGLTEAPGHRR